MNTEKQIGIFLQGIAQCFPGEIQPARMQVYMGVLKSKLRDQDLNQLSEKILSTCRFFPSVAEILDHAGNKSQSHRELATEFVDQMIALMQGSENVYEYAGAANYNFWKRTIGIARFDLNHIEPKFHRGDWIDRVTRAYDEYKEKHGDLFLNGKPKDQELLGPA